MRLLPPRYVGANILRWTSVAADTKDVPGRLNTLSRSSHGACLSTHRAQGIRLPTGRGRRQRLGGPRPPCAQARSRRRSAFAIAAAAARIAVGRSRAYRDVIPTLQDKPGEVVV